MTAEVAVVNKSAIALAADSAVTLRVHGRHGNTTDKVYNTANKLFTLSKYHPVGIMIYNVMELGGVPWETIVKEFRKHLAKSPELHLDGYCSRFFGFLNDNKTLFTDNAQEDVLLTITFRFLASLRDKESICSNSQAKDVFDDEIQRLENIEFAGGFDDGLLKQVRNDYKDLFDKAASIAFKPSYIKNCKTKCRHLASLALTKNEKLEGFSGVVIAGFGENDAYPKLTEYHVDLVIKGRVRKIEKQTFCPEQYVPSKVIPFAQDRMVRTIMDGINPTYNEDILRSVQVLLKGFPKEIIDQINELSDAQKRSYIHASGQSVNKATDSLFEKMNDIRYIEHKSPIETAIAVMPFSELATVAEVFVNVEQIRQRMSLEAETVGGPIDVAVISKGDGFVWIKRKHYFNPELNQSYLTKYLES